MHDIDDERQQSNEIHYAGEMHYEKQSLTFQMVEAVNYIAFKETRLDLGRCVNGVCARWEPVEWLDANAVVFFLSLFYFQFNRSRALYFFLYFFSFVSLVLLFLLLMLFIRSFVLFFFSFLVHIRTYFIQRD